MIAACSIVFFCAAVTALIVAAVYGLVKFGRDKEEGE